MEPPLPTGKMNAFMGAAHAAVIQGPASLYRFSNNPAGLGEWWIEEAVFQAIYNEARRLAMSAPETVSAEFRRLYRERLAVSLDWNDLAQLYRMDVPDGASITLRVGVTAAQPAVSFAEQFRRQTPVGDMLEGGSQQVLLEHPPVQWIKKVSV